jgi:D-serine deaminase-like pyridoxal phosphate-dependent protein
VISVSEEWVVADCGLKALGMDHGNPSVEGAHVWFCSDEHMTFATQDPVRVCDRVHVIPAHVDPTVAYHDHLHLVDGDDVLERWAVDLRGW